MSGLGPQSALETLAVCAYSCGFRVSLWACAWHWKLVTGIGPGSCRCTARGGSPQSTYSSGGQLLASRLVSHTHTVAEASAGYQYGSHVCWGKGREGKGWRESKERAGVCKWKNLWGETSVVRSVGGLRQLCCLGFFSSESCWGPLQNQSLGICSAWLPPLHGSPTSWFPLHV